MTSEERSPKEIERDIERERAGLTNTLDELQDKFSVESVVRQVSDQFRENGGDIARSVSRSVKDNPVALALTGVGLAWMIFGGSSNRRDDDDRYYATRRRQPRRDRYVDDDDYDDRIEGGTRHSRRRPTDRFSRANPNDPYYDGPYASADLPGWATDPANYRDDEDGSSLTDRVRNAAGSVREGASSAASSVGEKANAIGSAVSGSASSAGSTVSSAAKSASEKARNAGQSAKSTVANVTEQAAERAAALRDRLSEGTEALSEEARDRVVAAREKAVEARQVAMWQARKSSERASDLFEDQPLVAGALALAVGAAIGAALPRSQMEDDYMGAQSDSLMSDAERIFEEEKQKLTEVAGAAVEEAKSVAAEVKSDMDGAAKPGETAADAVVDKVKSSAKRVADKVKSEADNQDLGKSTS